MLIRALLLLSLFVPLNQLLAADESPTASKVRIAKDLYYADRDKAEASLISALTRRLEAAKKSGDLKTLEALQTELDAFRSTATLPKLVPVRDYETALKVARTKYENVMAAGIKVLTQAGSLEEAKALDQQLKNFQATAVAAATAKENAAPAKEVFSWNQFPDPAKIPLKQFQPGLIMYEFPREPEQTDGEKAYVDIEKFKDPIGPPQLVKSLNWKYTASRNAIASGYLKIPKDGEYSSYWSTIRRSASIAMVKSTKSNSRRASFPSSRSGLSKPAATSTSRGNRQGKKKWGPYRRNCFIFTCPRNSRLCDVRGL